jgi:hypothetical protein
MKASLQISTILMDQADNLLLQGFKALDERCCYTIINRVIS